MGVSWLPALANISSKWENSSTVLLSSPGRLQGSTAIARALQPQQVLWLLPNSSQQGSGRVPCLSSPVVLVGSVESTTGHLLACQSPMSISNVSCSSSHCPQISKWISLKYILGVFQTAVFSLDVGTNPLRGESQFGTPRGQPCLFSKPDILGASHFGADHNSSLFHEKCLSGEILLFGATQHWEYIGFNGRPCLSASPAHLSVVLLSFALRSHSSGFRSFSEKNDPYVVVDLVCTWEVSSESSYATILDPSSLFNF